MMTNVVEYFVFCFSRTLKVTFVDEVNEYEVLKLIDDAYCAWHNGDYCETCEDYIIGHLEYSGYEIEEWDSIDDFEQAL